MSVSNPRSLLGGGLVRSSSKLLLTEDLMESEGGSAMARSTSLASLGGVSNSSKNITALLGHANDKTRLSSVDAIQVAAVLEDTQERLAVLSTIAPDLLAHREELANMVGEEITRIIEEQRGLELKYEQLISQRGGLKSLSNKSKFKENQAAIEEVARELRQTTKVLCSSLKENPNVAENIMKIQNERSAVSKTIADTAGELSESATFRALSSTVNEEKQRHESLMETIGREKEAAAAVKTLTRELSDDRAEREREIAVKNKTIAELKQSLHELKTDAAVKKKFMRKEKAAALDSVNRVFRQEEGELQAEIERLTKALAVERRVNNESVEFLKRRANQMQQTIQNWNDKYDFDIEEKEREVENLKAVQANDFARLQELQESFRVLKDEFEEESRIVNERVAREELYRKQMISATKIQALFRGYIARKKLRKKKRRRKTSKSASRGGARRGTAAKRSVSKRR